MSDGNKPLSHFIPDPSLIVRIDASFATSVKELTHLVGKALRSAPNQYLIVKYKDGISTPEPGDIFLGLASLGKTDIDIAQPLERFHGQVREFTQPEMQSLERHIRYTMFAILKRLKLKEGKGWVLILTRDCPIFAKPRTTEHADLWALPRFVGATNQKTEQSCADINDKARRVWSMISGWCDLKTKVVIKTPEQRAQEERGKAVQKELEARNSMAVDAEREGIETEGQTKSNAKEHALETVMSANVAYDEEEISEQFTPMSAQAPGNKTVQTQFGANQEPAAPDVHRKRNEPSQDPQSPQAEAKTPRKTGQSDTPPSSAVTGWDSKLRVDLDQPPEPTNEPMDFDEPDWDANQDHIF